MPSTIAEIIDEIGKYKFVADPAVVGSNSFCQQKWSALLTHQGRRLEPGANQPTTYTIPTCPKLDANVFYVFNIHTNVSELDSYSVEDKKSYSDFYAESKTPPSLYRDLALGSGVALALYRNYVDKRGRVTSEQHYVLVDTKACSVIADNSVGNFWLTHTTKSLHAPLLLGGDPILVDFESADQSHTQVRMYKLHPPQDANQLQCAWRSVGFK